MNSNVTVFMKAVITWYRKPNLAVGHKMFLFNVQFGFYTAFLCAFHTSYDVWHMVLLKR
jgi:hypothetical protein